MTGFAGGAPVPPNVRDSIQDLADGQLRDAYQSAQPGTPEGDAILEMYGHIADAQRAGTVAEALEAINQAYVAGNSRLQRLETQHADHTVTIKETIQHLDALARTLE